jgi:hypothetical protein
MRFSKIINGILLVIIIVLLAGFVYYSSIYNINYEQLANQGLIKIHRSQRNFPQQSTQSQQNVTDKLYYVSWLQENKFVLVGMQTGRVKEFIPEGYGIVSMGEYQMFPTYLILMKNNNLYSYSVEDTVVSKIFLDDKLLLKKNEKQIRAFPSITEKDKFLIRIDTLDLSQVSEFDGSSPVLSSRSYYFNASTNKLQNINMKDFGYRCVKYDSKNSRLFSWPCGEGVGSGTPVYMSNLDGTGEKEVVSTKELAKESGPKGNAIGRVEYNEGLIFAEKDNDFKITVLDLTKPGLNKDFYTVSESVKSQIPEIYISSAAMDKSRNTIVFGGRSVRDGSYVLLLMKYNSQKQVIQSKFFPETVAEHLSIYDGKVYHGDGVMGVINLDDWQDRQSVPSVGSFWGITLFNN